MAVYPAPETGTDCGVGSPDDCGVPRDATLQIRFDRYLLPETAVRQSIRVYTGDPDLGVFLQPEYDLVERVLSYRLADGGTYLPGVLYTVELVVPTDADSYGFRAFDGASLAEGPVPLKFDFRTAKADPPPAASSDPPVTCAAILTAFQNGSCTGSACHKRCDDPTGSCSQTPRMGLMLDSADAIRETAIGKPAHETEIGSKTGVVLENPVRLGVNMPIVDPFRPDNSYLMYKLLRKTDSFRTAPDAPQTVCDTRYQVGFGPDGECPPPPAAESQRLREWFVRGEPMPLGDLKLDNNDPRARLRLIQRWIREGARLGTCPQ